MIDEVEVFLLVRIKVCIDVGIEESKIMFDLGFGFGKIFEYNY